MEWSEESIDSAQAGLNHLNAQMRVLYQTLNDIDVGNINQDYKNKF